MTKTAGPRFREGRPSLMGRTAFKLAVATFSYEPPRLCASRLLAAW